MSSSADNEYLSAEDKSFEEDDDVIIPKASNKCSTSKLNQASSFLTTSDGFTTIKDETIIKSLIENRRGSDASWREAAEAIFSHSHPFTISRNLKSPKNGNENSISHSESTKEPLKRDISNFKDPQKKKNDNKESPASAQRNKPHGTEESPTSVKVNPSANVSNENKSPDVNDEKKICKRKRSSISVSRKNSAYLNSERLLLLKSKVEAAVKEHKVYSMTGHYNSVRKALRERGWVEKIDSNLKGGRRRSYSHKFEDADGLFVLNKNEQSAKEHKEQCEAEIINRMLRNITEDLCWLSKPYPYCWKDINKCDMINRLPKAYFSNKVGLATSLANMQWFYEAGICSTQYPRTYNISVRDEYEAFQEDFRLTACVSTLKWLTETYKQSGESAISSIDGRVDINIIDFAIKRCTEHIRFREHDDIDIWETPKTWDHQWDHFLTQYYKLINESNILRVAKNDPPIMATVSNAQAILNQLRPHWPQMDIEGINDWWIVKPGGRCCGNGIVIRNNLDDIMAVVNPTVTRETRYVVQKYIEKPLLIYKTKFDIRQWFLVTNVYPLTIWMYKESYLRFCSSQFNLKSVHESIHLCNNAVQRRYKNGKRDSNLPDENMWDCYTFQTHLKAIGYGGAWEDLIYPGMRESFVGALLASQDNMERRRNCFELYGADFMISEQITDGPWLIEINSNPAMDASTSITARMCPQVLEDIIKVVIDRRNDRNASTGAFELAYRQNCPPIPPYLGMSLCIRGKKAFKSSTETRHPRRPYFNHQSSDSEDTSSDSDDNIVQKRCSTDFMQPIKTLRDEIQRIGRSAFLTVRKGENMSDSCTNDSDTSTDRRMTLEGKEMELKKKKVRKKRNHGNGSERNRDNWNKKTIKKDSRKNSKKNPPGSVRGFSLSNNSENSQRKENEAQNETSSNINEIRVPRPLIITGLWEPEFSEDKTAQKIHESHSHIYDQKTSFHLRVNGGNCSSSRDNSNSSRGSFSSPGDSDRNSSDANDLKHTDRNRHRKSNSDFSTALSIVTPELFLKTRNRNKWQARKSSMDYFREWKFKIDETRRNCEDALNKLKRFKEDNSRTKFQDLIKQKVEEEQRIIAQMKKEKFKQDESTKRAKKKGNDQEGLSPERRAANMRCERIIANRDRYIFTKLEKAENLPKIKGSKQSISCTTSQRPAPKIQTNDNLNK